MMSARLLSRPAVVLAAGALLVAGRALAQRDPPVDERLRLLDAASRRGVEAVVDSARAEHLPTEPLVDKALEGARKGAAPLRIVSAVRGLAADLRAARGALGRHATVAELGAGATALHAGLTARDLEGLRAAAHGRRRDLTVPLTVAADLTTRGVSTATASRVVRDLAAAGARDADLALFQHDVRTDIERGADPSSVATARARALTLRLREGR